MTNQDWLISIENSARALCDMDRADEVAFILRERGDAESIEELSPSHYSEVFDELFQREIDMQDYVF